LVARELQHRHHAIKALVRNNDLKSLDGIDIEFVKGDLNDPVSLQKLMDSCDAVIHAAAIISIAGGMNGMVHATNVEGTRRVMEAANAAAVKRVIYIGSIQAHQQKPLHDVLDETRALALNDSFAYDRSKRDGQQIALSYASSSLDVLVMNPTSILSPFDYRPSKLGRAIINMAKGKLPFVFHGGSDFCDGRDIAHAVVNGLQMGQSGEVYLLSGKWHSLKDFFTLLAEVAGRENKPLSLHPLFGWIGLPFIYLQAWLTKKEPLYTKEAIVAIQDCNRFIRHEKATNALNYRARPLKDTLQDTYAWFYKNGYLG